MDWLTRMIEHWASYFSNVNNKLASIFLDIHLRNVAPDSARPWLLWVWIYFKRPRHDGLSSSEEFATLCAIEDKLNLTLMKDGHTVLGGRITTDGRREFYYYASSADAFEAALKGAMNSFPDYDFDFGTQHDPQWNQYVNVLFPSDDDLQKILNREVLDVMEKEGDQPETPREVMHWAYFPSEKNRTDFEGAVRANEYRLDSENHHPESENPFGVCFAKIQSCTGEAIDNAVMALLKLAKQHHGDYDGWEAQVITSKTPATIKPN